MRLSKLAVNQVMAAMIQNHPLNSKWTSQSVSKVIKSIPTFFFQSPKSIKARKGSVILVPADPHKLNLGLNKAMEFFYWVENNFEFAHDEITCREMACLLAKGSNVKTLRGFLKEMSRREVSGLVTVETITCLIKVLAKIGLADEALAMFYRMKMFHCPNVYTYNAVIYALCSGGNFKKAKFLFEQMELPGFRCPPNKFTYTTLISAYCKHALQSGCKKEIRKRLGEADNLFRIMLFKGFNPDIATYNCLIDGCCKSFWTERAMELFDDMEKRCCETEYDHLTFNPFINYYCVTNEIDKAIEVLRTMQGLDWYMPTRSSYTPIIHALCKAGRVIEARDIVIDMIHQSLLPCEFTYKLVQNMLKSISWVEEISFLDNMELGTLEKSIEAYYEYKKVMKAQNLRSDDFFA